MHKVGSVMEVEEEGLVLTEIMPGSDLEEILSCTDADRNVRVSA